MAVEVIEARPPLAEAPIVPEVPPAPGGGGDDWPHTTRVLPWLLAAFTAMLWLIPFDSIQLPIHLPVDSAPDRVLILIMAGVWFASLVAPGRSGPRPRRSLVLAAFLTFFLIAAASIAANLEL